MKRTAFEAVCCKQVRIGSVEDYSSPAAASPTAAAMKIAHLIDSQPKAPEEEVPLVEMAVAATEENVRWYDYVQKLLLR